jgi:transposase-like protein
MRKRYTPKQKAQIVLEILKEERGITQIASEFGIHPNQLYKWKAQVLDRLPNVFEDEHKTEKALKESHERQLQKLYAEIGRLTTQLRWLQKKSGIELIEK